MTIGKIKVYFDMWMTILQRGQAILIVYLAIINKLWWGWILIYGILSFGVLYLWIRFVFPSELAVANEKNPEWKRMMSELEEIKRLVSKR